MKQADFENSKNRGVAQVLLAFALTLACVAITYVAFGIRYELNDDAIISNIAAGAYGEGTQYLVYVNVLLGWLLKPFYWLPGNSNWFVILLLAGGVACFSWIGNVLLKKWGWKAGTAAFIAFLALVGVDFFQRFHYVKYAGLFLTIGLLLICKNLGQWNKSAVIGLVVALIGSMLRFQQFFAIGGLAAALLLWKFLSLNKAQKIKAATTVAVLIVVAFGLKSVDSLVYSLNDGWKAYVEHNTVRTEISDFKLQFLAGPEELESLGYSGTDVEMLQSWNFYDREVFSTQSLEQIVENLPGNSLGNTIRQGLGAGFTMLTARPMGFLLAAVLLAWIFLSDKKSWPALLGTLGVLAAQVFYLCWQGRLPDTIHFSLTLSALMFCACTLQEIEVTEKERWVSLLASLLIVCSIPNFVAFKQSAQDYWESRTARETEVMSFIQDKGTLYLADVSLVDAANGYNVWQTKPKGYFENVVFTGSWLMQAPFQEEALHRFGLQNVYRDSMDRADVVYLDFVYRALKEDYLRQHYAPEAVLEVLQEGVNVNAYAAHSNKTGSK